jgi:hypothetical protein
LIHFPAYILIDPNDTSEATRVFSCHLYYSLDISGRHIIPQWFFDAITSTKPAKEEENEVMRMSMPRDDEEEKLLNSFIFIYCFYFLFYFHLLLSILIVLIAIVAVAVVSHPSDA